jgi:hypothetical protein
LSHVSQWHFISGGEDVLIVPFMIKLQKTKTGISEHKVALVDDINTRISCEIKINGFHRFFLAGGEEKREYKRELKKYPICIWCKKQRHIINIHLFYSDPIGEKPFENIY